VEIHQLRYFCAVARAGSFTKAATQEGVTQPSLSQQIMRLERALGSKLFDRLGRGVKLTECGRALLPQAEEILRRINTARSSMDTLRFGVAGRLAVGCIPTITPYFLAPNLGEFARLYPEVELRLIEDITPNLIGLLQSGEIDVAVVSPPVKNPDIVCSDLFREPIVVAVGKGHRLARAESASLPDLREERLLLLKEGHCFRDNALTLCNRGGLHFVSIFETNQFSSILPLVAAGFGISLVPQMAARTSGGCSYLCLEREAFRRVGYMRIRQRAMGTAQRAFINWLRAVGKKEDRKTTIS
jgi:LysR family hydrogen peroxide-inducible transcriptional activator